ncbi:hypothetical protein Skr01_23260 [Sphaerisporangium krabiense]|uniref:Putative membrane protein n=1 Tax=Sphaerisporangium krabiense TaxID=763782 RepID=A0A7W9DRG5_9ACTN|nr:MFS transporter [Sphaerisporangium krabiense]MBB5628074.1 putative membrane protein [Sphaerisporangium krabiense]GII62241.1 hypothetical protein Skr01_23260 [Sphaerisporangium krabiense]
MEASLALRLARSAVFTVVCVGLAAGAHRFAGADGPGVGALASGGLAVMAATALLARRERSPATVVAWLLAGQLLLHKWFGAAVVAAPVHGHGMPVAHGQGLGVGVGMLLAHLTAALLTGWWLARGESALWSLLRAAGARAVRRLGVPLALLRRGTAPPPRPVPVRDVHAVRIPAGRVLRHSLARRGPPPVTVF